MELAGDGLRCTEKYKHGWKLARQFSPAGSVGKLWFAPKWYTFDLTEAFSKLIILSLEGTKMYMPESGGK